MSDTVIKVGNLSKSYMISHKANERYVALRDVIADKFKAVGSMFSFGNQASSIEHRASSIKEEFYALRDVSFEVKQGDRVGIIGRNGAGKSTLLKILSRITEPTSGRIEITGRVASLLEVGTGFHPELTGRENIFLNGAILGMSKAEIKNKFDEIVDFAEIEKFLDTPVKRYSSGMYVRLAFAVAAHLEPEILVVDEVLAVGDAQFQKKCLGKMEEVGKEGRTVLFVSHNMAAIQVLCTHAILLDRGNIIGQGDVSTQIEDYLSFIKERTNTGVTSACKIGFGIELKRFEFDPNPIESGKETNFSLELWAPLEISIDSIVVILHSSLGMRVATLDLRHETPYRLDGKKPLVIRGKIKSLPLVEGQYSAGFFLASPLISGDFLNLVTLTVINRQQGENKVVPYPANLRGIVELDYDLELKYGNKII